jgi:hypothetical protein
MADVGRLLRRARGHAGDLERVERCSFHVPVRPGPGIAVLARAATGARIETEVQVHGAPAARAVLHFREAP